MTRESAKQIPNAIPIQLFRYHDYVDKIYDDLESRKCENCTWNEKDYDEKGYCTYLKMQNMEYCSKFERKEQ